MSYYKPNGINISPQPGYQQQPFGTGFGKQDPLVQGQSGPVVDAYRNTLGRNPDQAGLDFYRQQLSNGVPMEEIQRLMAGSPEAQGRNYINNIPTGLGGSEQALTQGMYGALDEYGQGAIGALNHLGSAYTASQGQLNNALGNIQQGTQQGLGILNNAYAGMNNAYQQGFGQLNQATNNINGLFNNAQAQVGQAGQLAQQGINQGQGYLQGAQANSINHLNKSIDRGVSGLDPYAATGRQAQHQQAALSGALGAAAQQQAFNTFQNSPGQKWLEEQGSRQVLSGAAATGGLGGGQVGRELTKFGQGLALQDLDRQTQQLGQVAGQGLQAAGQIGQLRGNQGITGANLIGSLGQAQGNLSSTGAQLSQGLGIAQGQLGGQQAGLLGSLGQSGAALSGQLGNNISSLGQVGAGMANNSGIAQAGVNQYGAGQAQQFGQLGAGMIENLGINRGNTIRSTGQELAAGRAQAGRDMADVLGGAGGSLADLQANGGAVTSDIIAKAGLNVADLARQAGVTEAEALEQLAVIFSNIATGTGSQQAKAQLAGFLPPNSAATIDSIIAGVGGALSQITKKSTPTPEEAANTAAANGALGTPA